MYKITGKNTFEVAPDTNPAEGLLDGTYYHLDIEKLDGRTWHILKDHKSYYVQWVERSEDGKTFTLKIPMKSHFGLSLLKSLSKPLSELSTSNITVKVSQNLPPILDTFFSKSL